MNATKGFIPNPNFSQVTSAMTGTITMKKGTGASVNVAGWKAIRIVPTALSSYYYNTDTTKTYPLPANIETLIHIGSSYVTQVVLVLGAATASVQGM